MLMEGGEVVCAHSSDDSVPSMVNAVVEITVKLEYVNEPQTWTVMKHSTHKDNLMVQHHRPISSTNICQRLRSSRKHRFLLQNSSCICIPPPDRILSCSQMAIDDANRRISNHKSRHNRTLMHHMRILATAHHNDCRTITALTLFP